VEDGIRDWGLGIRNKVLLFGQKPGIINGMKI
jgi:hypothetical protein